MNKKAFTLIEVMIVIAIIGIAFSPGADKMIFDLFKVHENSVIEQKKVFMFYKELEKLSQEAKAIINVSSYKAMFDNFKISVSKSGNLILLNNKKYEFKNFRISNIYRCNENSVCFNIKNLNNNYSVFLCVGNKINSNQESSD